VRRGERGLTLVEMMVVLVIVVVIMGLAMQSVRGSRNTGGTMEVRAVALRYADAVERFKADHGRRVPQLGSATWPTADAKLGPRTVVNVKQPLPEILERPEPLNAEIVAGGSPAPEGGTIVYERRTPYQFTVTAYWNGKSVCVAGDTAAGDNQC
jgi:prepilin-type N-terminal cleavage/methylation domain-containing protein